MPQPCLFENNVLIFDHNDYVLSRRDSLIVNQVIGFNKQIVKFEFVGFVPPIVGRGYDPAAHVSMQEMYVLP